MFGHSKGPQWTCDTALAIVKGQLPILKGQLAPSRPLSMVMPIASGRLPVARLADDHGLRPLILQNKGRLQSCECQGVPLSMACIVSIRIIVHVSHVQKSLPSNRVQSMRMPKNPSTAATLCRLLDIGFPAHAILNNRMCLFHATQQPMQHDLTASCLSMLCNAWMKLAIR